MELKNEIIQISASVSMPKPSVKAIFRGLSVFIEMGHQKEKNRKMGCKNNQMYLFRTRNSHFNEDSFFLSQYSYSFCTGALYGADQFGKETASFPMSP